MREMVVLVGMGLLFMTVVVSLVAVCNAPPDRNRWVYDGYTGMEGRDSGGAYEGIYGN
jgi:hypothetical protein